MHGAVCSGATTQKAQQGGAHYGGRKNNTPYCLTPWLGRQGKSTQAMSANYPGRAVGMALRGAAQDRETAVVLHPREEACQAA